VVPSRYFAVADRGGNEPWNAQRGNSLKEQQMSDALDGFINLGLHCRMINGVDCETAQRKTNKAFTSIKGAFEKSDKDFHKTMTNEEEVQPPDWVTVIFHQGGVTKSFMVDRGERVSHNWAAIAKQIKKGAAEITIWKRPPLEGDMADALNAIAMEEPVKIKTDHRLVKYKQYFTLGADGMEELHIEYNKFRGNKRSSEYPPSFLGLEVGSKSVQELTRDLLGWDQEIVDTRQALRQGGQVAGSTKGG
jgi:hypothetical protein